MSMQSETIFEGADPITSVDVHTNGKEISIATLNGQIAIWEKEDSQIKTTLDCYDDIRGGRLKDDRNTSKNSTKNAHFNSI
mmetsp:Transcript_11942/g.13573  ORF Transcript_11942/g.13573 Transcript_11942/m.13573 type:complete len:81 (+) Transcript_11942:1087-1329(+)